MSKKERTTNALRDFSRNNFLGITTLTFVAFIFSHRWFYSFNCQILEDDVDHESKFKFQSKSQRRINKYISEWQQEPWEHIDDQRIFMHGLIEEGNMSIKQICSAESAAKHNPDRSVQIFIRLPFHNQKRLLEQHRGNRGSALRAILKQYTNLQIVLFNETEYFRNTALMAWYNSVEWRQSRHNTTHLSGYARVVSLFRGGGIFIDLDAVITLKSFTGPKWQNFFVKSKAPSFVNEPTYIISSEILHLVFGHHLSDEMILNLGNSIYDPLASIHNPFLTTLHASISNICTGEKGINLCPDVQLRDHQDVFLPNFNSVFWSSVIFQLQQENIRLHPDDESIRFLVKNAIESHGASLVQWKSITFSKMNKEPAYEILFLTLLSHYCPLTVAHFLK